MEEKIEKLLSQKFIIYFLVFILFLHALALINHWYWTYAWFDIPMHFLGGFWVAMVSVWFINKYLSQILKFHNFLISLIIILSFVALIGVFWEFLEFLYDVFVSSRGYLGLLQLSAADTIKDLFFDLVGGLAFWIVYKYFLNRPIRIQ